VVRDEDARETCLLGRQSRRHDPACQPKATAQTDLGPQDRSAYLLPPKYLCPEHGCDDRKIDSPGMKDFANL
jgi:hypothetical protein